MGGEEAEVKRKFSVRGEKGRVVSFGDEIVTITAEGDSTSATSSALFGGSRAFSRTNHYGAQAAA
jgi:hypothetical protein